MIYFVAAFILALIVENRKKAADLPENAISDAKIPENSENEIQKWTKLKSGKKFIKGLLHVAVQQLQLILMKNILK